MYYSLSQGPEQYMTEYGPQMIKANTELMDADTEYQQSVACVQPIDVSVKII